MLFSFFDIVRLALMHLKWVRVDSQCVCVCVGGGTQGTKILSVFKRLLKLTRVSGGIPDNSNGEKKNGVFQSPWSHLSPSLSAPPFFLR